MFYVYRRDDSKLLKATVLTTLAGIYLSEELAREAAAAMSARSPEATFAVRGGPALAVLAVYWGGEVL